MSKPEHEILRDVAELALRRRLDGRAFPAAVDAAADRYGRDAPDVVRRAARLIRWRGRNLSASGVAAALRGMAGRSGVC